MFVCLTAFQESLSQMDQTERQQRLDETFQNVRKDYERILAGDYQRRGVDDARGEHLRDDVQDARDYYGSRARDAAAGARDAAKDAAREVGDVFSRAKDAFNQAFKGGGR